MNNEYFTTVDKYLTERLVNHTRFELGAITVNGYEIEHTDYFNEFSEYRLFESHNILMLSLKNIEIYNADVFLIQVPDTIEKLKIVLDVLNPEQ